MAWTKKELKQFEGYILADFRKKLESLRRSGAVPDGFEESEPASLPKIAMMLTTEDIALTDSAKRELKNMRHFA